MMGHVVLFLTRTTAIDANAAGNVLRTLYYLQKAGQDKWDQVIDGALNQIYTLYHGPLIDLLQVGSPLTATHISSSIFKMV